MLANCQRYKQSQIETSFQVIEITIVIGECTPQILAQPSLYR